MPLDGRLRVGREGVEEGWVALVPAGLEELPIEADSAWREWRDRTDRFGDVRSPLARIKAPRPPWLPASEG